MTKSDLRNLRKEVDTWYEDLPERWQPLPGDVLIGEVVGYTCALTESGWARVVIIERENGTGDVAVWLDRGDLLAEFERDWPRVYDLVAIKYEHVAAHSEIEVCGFSVVVARLQPRRSAPATNTNSDRSLSRLWI